MRRATVFFAIAAILCVSAASVDERVIGLQGQPNFRDIGGYETSDGRKIRFGLIYRSGELPRLTDNDVKKLQALGVKTVVNFLTTNEIAYRGKDRLPAGVHHMLCGCWMYSFFRNQHHPKRRHEQALAHPASCCLTVAAVGL